MPDEVDRDRLTEFRQPKHIPGVGFGVPPAAMQQEQRFLVILHRNHPAPVLSGVDKLRFRAEKIYMN